MMTYTAGRLFAIALIFAGASVAWMILGGTISSRTGSAGDRLEPEVVSTWGSAQKQPPAQAHYTDVYGTLSLNGSDIKVNLALEHRQKGLLWYSTYVVGFNALYTFQNSSDKARPVEFLLPFPASKALFENVVMEANGQPLAFSSNATGIFATAQVAPGETVRLRVGYQSHGLGSWRYKLDDQIGQARNFQLVMRTNFDDVDFPTDTLSPNSIKAVDNGKELTWRYSSLISGFAIGMTMPDKLQPGPLAGEISFFAPVSLLLFFFVMIVITLLRGIDLHPVNYFFLACSFFAFHLLLAYLADQISIHLAFLICSAVSIGLVVSYMRIVVGPRFAVMEAGLAMLVYLVLFSYTFFLKGLTGLTIAIGCVITLAVVMKLTANIRWSERLRELDPGSASGTT
jgi:hypothetical protein